MANLKIYKASAGSGKTFQITRSYLLLVFREHNAYRNILAVTFTNKATAEMKGRILKELFLLASGEKSGHLETLKSELNASEGAIRSDAMVILKRILHDYSRFSVSTIDSFFQRVIRAFSREIRLHASFRTELDTSTVMEEAVDRLFLEIDENSALRDWFLEFAENKLQDGKNWNFKSDILQKGNAIFGEEFKLFSEELVERLTNKTFLAEYILALRNIVKSYDDQLRAIGRRGLELMAQHGIRFDQFKSGKTSFANHFNKLVNGNFEPAARVRNACDNVDSWVKKTDKPDFVDRVQQLYNDGLNALLVEAVTCFDKESLLVNAANAVLPNLYTLGLLTDLARHVKEITAEKNILLLTDSTQLLRNVISGSDTPFVYEKMGEVYRHFMLDEFQDTSRLQWQNFLPLVENAMADGHGSMVVGDVKQSIYRWRNGDWNLLATQLEADFRALGTAVVSLDTNWRSSKNVINFNNIIFKEASRLLNEEFASRLSEAKLDVDNLPQLSGLIERAYQDHFQNFSNQKNEGGRVEVEFLESGSRKSEFREAALEKMIEKIEALQVAGSHPRDIAVLVRDKRDGNLVADALLTRKLTTTESAVCYDVISNDSLVIGKAASVKFLVNFFHILTGPDNAIREATVIHEYQAYLTPLMPEADRIRFSHSNEAGQLDLLFSETDEDEVHKGFAVGENYPIPFDKWFDKEQNQTLVHELRSLPLYNLAERIVRDFGLNLIKGDWPFLQAFLDVLLEFSRTESADVTAFLAWWEEFGMRKTISVSDEQEAIRVFTIHKSKGLEFRHLIIPFCDWPVYPEATKAPLLWCKPQQEPFNALELIPVSYGKDLAHSCFANEYFQEMLYSAVDNLNLLYVALTRAEDSLTIFAPQLEDKKLPGTKISGLLQTIMQTPPFLDSEDLERYIDLAPGWDDEQKAFTLGEAGGDIGRKSTAQSGIQFRKLSFEGHGEKLQVKKHGADYFEISQSDRLRKVNQGNLIHELFEQIETADELENAIRRMEFEGKINQQDVLMLRAEIEAILKSPEVNHWFDGSYQVINERDILRGNDQKHRPDRVMVNGERAIVVDYKTGMESVRHMQQVQAYRADLLEMGYAKVDGFVWYINGNKVVPV